MKAVLFELDAIWGNTIISASTPAAQDEAARDAEDAVPLEEREVSVKMSIIVLETIMNSSTAPGGAVVPGGGVRSEDEHPACEIVVADRVVVSSRSSRANLPLYMLLPRLYTCPSFAVDNICSVGFEVEIQVTVHHPGDATADKVRAAAVGRPCSRPYTRTGMTHASRPDAPSPAGPVGRCSRAGCRSA